MLDKIHFRSEVPSTTVGTFVLDANALPKLLRLPSAHTILQT